MRWDNWLFMFNLLVTSSTWMAQLYKGRKLREKERKRKTKNEMNVVRQEHHMCMDERIVYVYTCSQCIEAMSKSQSSQKKLFILIASSFDLSMSIRREPRKT